MKLRDLQTGVQDYVLTLNEGITGQIRQQGALNSAARLEIYAEAYRLRLVEVLSVQYPVLRACMGADDFDNMAVTYIDSHPSRHFSVRWFGAGLGDFIRASGHYRKRPLLEEMARFEWALANAFDAEDIAALGHEALSAIPPPHWPSLVFTFVPGLGRIDCRWNTIAVWQALTGGADAPAAEQSAETRSWLVWRPGLASRFRELSTLEARVLDHARAGAAFADQCALLARDMADTEAAAALAAMVRNWVGDGIIAGVHPATPSATI